MTTQAIITEGDTARARRSDPVTSHRAADRSARTRFHVEHAVMSMLRFYGERSGSQLNAEYPRWATEFGWPPCHWDSPRKRAGDLVRKGLLVILNAESPRGTEHIYALPEASDD